jgi:GNAT superfamily N-acetyltransferase
MNIEIRKLTKELLNDWLNYFDNEAFSENGDWEGCYCMCYHWNKELQNKKPWNCTKSDAPYNRECAIEYINKGLMQGYLAYFDNKVVGWCNVNDKTAYGDINFRANFEELEKYKKVKAIVCFNIAPNYRGKGIATKILERICLDALQEGYEYIEAYPFTNDDYLSYHGPQSMYEKGGFVFHENLGICNVLRKYL